MLSTTSSTKKPRVSPFLLPIRLKNHPTTIFLLRFHLRNRKWSLPDGTLPRNLPLSSQGFNNLQISNSNSPILTTNSKITTTSNLNNMPIYSNIYNNSLCLNHPEDA